MRYAKVDKNQPEIVEALRKAGASVQSLAMIGRGCPDLVIAKDLKTWMVEVKGPNGKLTPDQIEWLADWKGVVHIVRSPEDALRLVGVIE